MAASSPPHIPGMGLYVNWVRVGDGGWREITFSLPFEPSLSHVHWRSPETPGNVERSVDSSSDTFPCNWVNSSPAKLKGKDKSEEWELEARWATHFTGLDGAWGKIPDTIGKTHLCEFVVRDEEIRELKVEAKQQWKGICSILDWLVYRFQLVFVQIINGGDICCRCCGGGGHFLVIIRVFLFLDLEFSLSLSLILSFQFCFGFVQLLDISCAVIVRENHCDRRLSVPAFRRKQLAKMAGNCHVPGNANGSSVQQTAVKLRQFKITLMSNYQEMNVFSFNVNFLERVLLAVFVKWYMRGRGKYIQ